MAVALPWIALGLSAAGTGMSVAGSLRQGAYQKAVADQNAALAGQNATIAEARAQAEREQMVLASSQFISKQRATAGTGGADVASASIVDVLSASRLLGTSDLEKEIYNTEMTKRGFRMQEDQFRAQGEAASYAGTYGAATSLLTGAGNAISAYGTNYATFGRGSGKPN